VIDNNSIVNRLALREDGENFNYFENNHFEGVEYYDPEKINGLLRREDYEFDASKLYFNLNKNNYIYVIIYSRYKSALETACLLSNRSKHKLKYMKPFDRGVLLVFKRYDKCKTWELK